MALTSSITVLFNCLLLLSLFVLASIAASIPANKPDDYSDLPFEFNPDRGTTVVEDNVLTQAVSSNGKTVLATNDPQPIKKYNFNNNNDNNANTANYVNDSDNSNDNNNNNNNNDSKKPKMQSLNPNQKEQLQSNKQQFGKKQGFNRLTSNNGVYTTTYMSPMQMNQLFYENFSRMPGMSGMPNVRIIYI